MVSAEGIEQLTGMGAPRGRAIAALRAKRNDVMAAAEAVFAGEFDHIPEDAEEPPAEAGSSKKVQPGHGDGEDLDEEMADDDLEDDGEAVDVDLSDNDEDDGEEAGIEIDEDEDFDFDVDVDGDEGGLDTDAYGGLTMNKDLKIEQTEITTETRAWLVPPTSGIAKAATDYPLSTKSDATPSGSRLNSASARGAADPMAETFPPSTADIVAVEVNSSEWLRGCPVGGEQSLLFGLYSQLRMHDVVCPHCKHSNKRFPELDASPSSSAGTIVRGGEKIRENMKAWPADHLLLVFPRAEQVIEHILRAAHMTCARCKAQFCAACGQKRKMQLPSYGASVSATENKPWDRKEREAVLYHCGAMQSIILGCGLIMVDRYNAALERATDSELSAAAEKNMDAVLEFNGKPPQFAPSIATATARALKSWVGDADADPVTGDFLLRMSTIVQPASHGDAADKKARKSKREKRKNHNSTNKTERKKTSKTDRRTSAGGLEAKVNNQDYDSLEDDDDDADDGEPIAFDPSWSYDKHKNKSAAGTGYSGMANETSNWKKTALAKQKRRDGLMEEMLATLRQFLPDAARGAHGMTDALAAKGKDVGSIDVDESGMSSRESAFETDWMPDATTLAHLRRRFLPLASSLLSSDSLSDMIERQSLFVELLRWFALFARHENLCPILAQPIMRVASVQPAVDKNGKKKGATEVLTTYVGSAGPMELVQSIVEQCKTFKEVLSTAKSTDPDNSDTAKVEQNKEEQGSDDEVAPELDPEEVRISEFCDRIIGISETIETQLRKTKGDAMVDKLLGRIKTPSKVVAKSSGPTTRSSQTAKATEMTDEEEKTAYEEWARPLLFDDSSNMQHSTSAEHTHYNHKYNTDIIACQSTPTRRTIAIAKELGNLNRSLPALFHGSIFLRRDESRIDVLKACIIGPEGSPYESGCYLFDIFLPADYNNVPPKCSIVNTGGGKYRHNPNLYADGKVCLSLLGTWSGPGWSAGQSTLLQVLLSIQSLVLSSEPCMNEPGWETYGGTDKSRNYTRNIRRMAVKVAMLDLLKNPPSPWEDVIRGHFLHKRRTIKKLLDKWQEDDDQNDLHPDGTSLMSVHSYGGLLPKNSFMSTQVAALKEELDKLS